MNNILKAALPMLVGICLFTACEDDRDSNPVINLGDASSVASTFVLNTPAFANNTFDLATTDSIALTWSQPAYGAGDFPVAAQYQIQLSLDGKFTTSYDEEQLDATGETVADYTQLGSAYTTPTTSIKIAPADLAKALQELGKYDEGAVPAEQNVYLRVKANLGGIDPVFSNVTMLSFKPYYVMLAEVEPQIWYLTGGCIGDGSWGNAPEKVGTAMIPFYVDVKETYDKRDGTGKLKYAGYFPAGGEFKIIEHVGNWDNGICAGDENGGSVYRDGGDDPGNIKVGVEGYYLLTLDTKTHELTWEKLADTPADHTSMGMPGGHNGWDVNGNPLTKLAANGHDWYGEFDVTTDGEVKFAADGAWDFNWGGGEGFPFGTGTQNGPNILFTAGKYFVWLNDITGQYMFIKQ